MITLDSMGIIRLSNIKALLAHQTALQYLTTLSRVKVESILLILRLKKLDGLISLAKREPQIWMENMS